MRVSSTTLRGELVRIIGGVDAEIRRFIAQHVAGEIESPQSKAAQIINVADSIDVAWSAI